MTKLSTVVLIAVGTATFWSLLSLLLHLPGVCTGVVAIFTFIAAFIGISVCMVAEN